MSKPVHSKNEILRSNTGLTINPSKAYSRSETRDKLTGLTIIQGGLFRQSQAIKNRFPSRATGTPRLDEHMLIVFCMLLVSSVQVKHQGSDQSLRLSVSIPSRSSIKDPIRVHGYQYPFHPGQTSRSRSRSTVFSIQSIQEKHQCSDLPAMVIVSAIQVKCQGPDFPAMGIAIDVRRQGCDLPAKCSVIQVNQQDSDLPSMVIGITKRYGPILTSYNLVLVSSHLGQASSSSLQPSRSSVKVPISRFMVIGITKIDEQSHSALFSSSVESIKIMLHGSGFSPWL
ncbi:hypothetical protein PHYBLDRAFT_168516 [Phycomyces blakesleeanus NRRL 1555(-)]|uniref:Uncharacterized protein n=1 Tax=Phycomyces blakesleeanus (strain ATCC 8743b / DSM 1359 / FGSC 10004 / NBRC 33097 / NRRL 1555) TaxID=763407 RepID=A0A167ML67_PHYB8|nr:hypothetical protein PHYBLDRAFT_168516 [Phycomyces blakesleeanus NRRL 1555(-)]OAD73166.1 hypothetical protein PHYBLDRAFT_168516 [Phycomyces blakesleeanus NRRL 1555(-)]|eukprot:XP_018291206.1 hypothetical protein PHYBLDRAFT_168516 [Phycomyces blakesleeanus NRRL 1555(-)]